MRMKRNSNNLKKPAKLKYEPSTLYSGLSDQCYNLLYIKILVFLQSVFGETQCMFIKIIRLKDPIHWKFLFYIIMKFICKDSGKLDKVLVCL